LFSGTVSFHCENPGTNWPTDCAVKVATVDLGAAENYAILAKTAISTVPSSAITGDIGVSPIAATFMTGFSFTNGPGGDFSESSQVSPGRAYCIELFWTGRCGGLAVSDMFTTYNDVMGRDNADASRINLGAGILGENIAFGGASNPLTPGVYTFSTGVQINKEIFFDAGQDEDAVFIIQMAGSLIQKADVTLVGGAQAKNIFWAVAGFVDVDPGMHLEGILLVKTKVLFKTESSLNGRVLTQTRCDLQKATIKEPAE
jgi:hypothetical protein